ncbi:related to TRM12 tRNA methyltransferase, required for the formation of the hypermodified nucleoside wybutosine in the phenylalanine-accepting tRNA [Phialocephala subalpina]|uniref:tRNA wybutosine-synthesizing protein 2 n=1 Tax=Phialocephala subalpina TaxID=576137 RepID=A0A1L7WGQ0_9HELO|nr:related to TRM12 tRNA methyltransferase, required for the formation of the hypermodified nucleoside wybutosine in the phenylalanine-accepting tRNA [Phialocephala subalpina]
MSADSWVQGPSARPPKPKPENPIEAAIAAWLLDLPADLTDTKAKHVHSIVSGAPKRWVVYSPMVLLPAGGPGSKWWGIAESSDPVLKNEQDRLWRLILNKISKKEGKGVLTHLAVNSGIPLHNPTSDVKTSLEADNEADSLENILRTPGGLVMLYGNFGSPLSPSQPPTVQDFEEAFWVSTKQNGITQVWAPRFTMFSRGNVKEKARLLDFQRSSQEFGTRTLGAKLLSNSTAVDLYAGIGYFVFSYVKLGMKRVIGWELNPWSVEGLRRGAIANGWTIKIVRHCEDLYLGTENIIVLAEDNKLALVRLQGLKSDCLDIKHVNCGLLPRSDLSWKMASEMTTNDGWLHLHENVGVEDIQTRKAEIENIFQGWLAERGDKRSAKVEHVEYVKTFAPGVWHCVFDVFINAS